MTLNLAGMLGRVQALLMDGGSRIFDVATVTEGVRLALGEYNLARTCAGLAVDTLNGLDGAVVSTLSAAHESLLVVGAAGYAASARAVDRAESFELDKESSSLLAWAGQRLGEFRLMLAMAYPGYAVAGGADGAGMDAGLLAATIAHRMAQTAQLDGQEQRAAAGAAQAAADRLAEAARLADLRSGAAPWQTWKGE